MEYNMTNEEILTSAINIGEQLLISGAEISRVEDTIKRICNAYGVKESHIFSIASCIIVTLETPDGQWITQTRRILSYGTDMYRLDRLNNLSRKICATLPSYEEVNAEYEEIIKSPVYTPVQQCAVCAMIAAAFTVFFGGTLLDGFAALFVERDSQKGIIIGAKGSLLKKIGQQARADLEKLLYCKVYLDLWVKVKADWRNQEKSLRQFGYKE